jgi:hypothetical protein
MRRMSRVHVFRSGNHQVFHVAAQGLGKFLQQGGGSFAFAFFDLREGGGGNSAGLAQGGQGEASVITPYPQRMGGGEEALDKFRREGFIITTLGKLLYGLVVQGEIGVPRR